MNKLTQARTGLRDWTAIIDHQHQLEGRKESREQLNEILQLLKEELVTNVNNLESRALTAEEERILDWFPVYLFSNSQLDAASRRDANSAAWIIESLSTRSGRSRVINCCGFMENVSSFPPGASSLMKSSAGCGKSVLW